MILNDLLNPKWDLQRKKNREKQPILTFEKLGTANVWMERHFLGKDDFNYLSLIKTDGVWFCITLQMTNTDSCP